MFSGSFLVMIMAARHIKRQERLELEAEIDDPIVLAFDDHDTHTASTFHTVDSDRGDHEFMNVFMDRPLEENTINSKNIPSDEVRIPHFVNIQKNIPRWEDHP